MERSKDANGVRGSRSSVYDVFSKDDLSDPRQLHGGTSRKDEAMESSH